MGLGIFTYLDKSLSIHNAQWAGKMIIGTNWNRLLVGCRFSILDCGAAQIAAVQSTPRFYLGAMSAPNPTLSNGPVLDTCGHFVGAVTTGASWTRATDGGGAIKYNGANMLAAKKVGATITTAGSAITNNRIITASFLAAHLVLIEKGSPNFTITQLGMTQDSSSVTTLASHLTSAMEINDSTLAGLITHLQNSTNQQLYLTTAATSLAVDEATNGYLDSIVVGWNRVFPIAVIGEMMFAKMA